MELQRRILFIWLAGGVFVSFSLMAIAQEKTFKIKYDDGEKFTFPIAFVAIQCLSFSLVAGVINLTCHRKEENKVPQKYYLFVALFCVAGMVLSNAALQYLSYPAKVIAKSCKPISVMIVGTIIAKKVHTIQKYFFVAMLIAGITLFTYADGKKSQDKEEIILGYVLVGVSLLMDGFLGAAQDLMRKIARPSSIHFMFFVNAWSMPLLIVLLAFSGETIPFIQFCIKHPIVNIYLSVVAIVGCFGQYFLSSLITNFGSLSFSLTMTTRKFFTVLFSVFFLGNSFNELQWLATFVIFIALLLNVFYGKKKIKCIEEESKDVKESQEVV